MKSGSLDGGENGKYSGVGFVERLTELHVLIVSGKNQPEQGIWHKNGIIFIQKLLLENKYYTQKFTFWPNFI